MRTTETVLVPAAPDRVFPLIVDLDRYPEWLGLVHEADPIPTTDPPAWTVEIRARVGPFARSKRLRMERVRMETDRLAEFERVETDGRSHARWSLCAELAPADDESTLVTMRLAYDGALWTGGLLERVLDDEIRRGRDGLTKLVSAEPTH